MHLAIAFAFAALVFLGPTVEAASCFFGAATATIYNLLLWCTAGIDSLMALTFCFYVAHVSLNFLDWLAGHS